MRVLRVEGGLVRDCCHSNGTSGSSEGREQIEMSSSQIELI